MLTGTTSHQPSTLLAHRQGHGLDHKSHPSDPVVQVLTHRRLRNTTLPHLPAGWCNPIRSFSACGAPPGPLPLARFEASSPTRRDTRFRPHILRQAAPGCLVILTRALRVPVLTATRGQQRPLQSSVTGFPQVSTFLVRTMIHPRSSKLGLELMVVESDVHARRPGDQPAGTDLRNEFQLSTPIRDRPKAT